MTKSKSTKRAMLGSAISLVLCFAMLLGTTFAWFTDSVSSTGNKIQAGNLKIDLQVLEDGTYKSVRNMTAPIFDYDKWEPGYTQVKTLKIVNEGNLALKYQLNVVAAKAGSILADVIDVYMCFGESDATSAADLADTSKWWKCGSLNEMMAAEDGFTQGKLLPAGATYDGTLLGKDGVAIGDITASVALHMQETAGNEYQTLDLGNIDIKLLATQYTYEEDSFDDQYDASASIEDVEVVFNMKTNQDASMTINAGENEKINMNGFSLNDSLVNYGKVTVNGNGGEISTTGAAGFQNYGDATITDVTMKAGSPENYASISRANSTTVYNNVDIDSKGGGVGAADGANVVFNSGSVAVNSEKTSGRYNFYTEGEGTEITINGGTFSFSKTLNQKRAYIYAGAGTTVYVNGGTFGPASTRDGYTAGILGSGTVIITGGTFGFDPSNWVKEGYQAVKSSDNTWTVSQAN